VESNPNAGTSAATAKSPAELALELYNILVPHSSDVRVRAVQSAMASLGETMSPLRSGGTPLSGTPSQDEADFSDLKLGPKTLRWAHKHGITRAILDEVFHLSDGQVDITASSVPGASKREMTVNCYLLSGLRGLLKDDAPSFDDGDAIALCKRLTAYDKNNHTSHRHAVGNRMTGTKPTFALTGPGETAAADLVKRMTTSRGG
jgi:hypothetical protein